MSLRKIIDNILYNKWCYIIVINAINHLEKNIIT
jgi:hypothetical protein